jgi:hypothetical protein
VHVGVLKLPSAPHVAMPPPEYPLLQITITISPVMPVMLPIADLCELATSVALHGLAIQPQLSTHTVRPSREEDAICIVCRMPGHTAMDAYLRMLQ